MRRFTRFLRVALLPVAVLAIVAGSSASASAAPLGDDSSPVTLTAPAPLTPIFRTFSMHW